MMRGLCAGAFAGLAVAALSLVADAGDVRFVEKTLGTMTARPTQYSVTVSPDGRHFTYRLRTTSGFVLFVDAQEVGPCADAAQPTYSADGSRFAYAAAVDGKARVVIDGKEGPVYDEVRQIATAGFSPDGTRFAYSARKGERWVAVVDGDEQAEYEKVGDIVFSPDSKRVAYKVKGPEGEHAIVDGKHGKPYDEVGWLTFSRDGSKLAYRARRGGQCCVVQDAEEGAWYPEVVRPVFSPDGSRLYYVVQQDGQARLCEHGKTELGPPYRAIGAPTFSADGKRLGYVARHLDGWIAVVDGKQGKLYPGIWYVRFSPDGQRTLVLAQEVQKGEKRDLLVVDGVEGPLYDSVSNAAFSPDGKSLAWIIMRAGKPVLVVDGVESASFDEKPLSSVIRFDSATSLSTCFIRGLDVIRLEATIQR